LSPPAPAGSCDVSGRVFEGRVVRDDTEDFVGNVTYNVLLARENGEHYVLPSEMTEDEELQVAVLVSAEEEKRASLGLQDTLAISMAPPPPPRSSHLLHRRAHRLVLAVAVHKAWDPWPEADPPVIGWLPPPPL
jgi:hypothetical protein